MKNVQSDRMNKKIFCHEIYVGNGIKVIAILVLFFRSLVAVSRSRGGLTSHSDLIDGLDISQSNWKAIISHVLLFRVRKLINNV